MKTFLPFICAGLALIGLLAEPVSAQLFQTHAPYHGDALADGSSGQFQPFVSMIGSPLPGRYWISASGTDDGVGFEGSYFTVGGKTRLGEDYFGARWLFEGRAHLSAQTGKPFANVGVERVFSIAPAGADVGFTLFYDVDDDQRGSLARTFHQIGVGGYIKTKHADITVNGYIPVGVTEVFEFSPGDCFADHFVIERAGFNTAFEGFDAELRFRPEHLKMVNGTLDLGGYYYRSEITDSFAGFRTRLGIQILNGLGLSTQVSFDDEFDFTWLARATWEFGPRAAAQEYSNLGRDLETTIRNDHIVRIRRPTIFVVDPDTGSPYQVQHVDNLAAAGGDGTAERPFNSLAAAETASAADDIIFVREGDGTSRNYDQGITLKDGQLFLGDGMRHIIPRAGGGEFVLCNDTDGNKPIITNVSGGNVVNLANRNTVAHFNIDGDVDDMGGGNAANGIVGNMIRDVTIRDTMIMDFNAPNGFGVLLTNVAGNVSFENNMVDASGLDGVSIDNRSLAGAPQSLGIQMLQFSGNEFTNTRNNAVSVFGANDAGANYMFTNNMFDMTGDDAVHIEDYNGRMFSFDMNTMTNTGGDGIEMVRYLGMGGMYLVTNHTSDMEGRGVVINDANGLFLISDSMFTNTTGDAIFLDDVRGMGDVLNNTFMVIGNAAVHVDNDFGTFGIDIMNNIITGDTMAMPVTPNAFGVIADARGMGTMLTTVVSGNPDISYNTVAAIRLRSFQGATHTAFVNDNINMFNNEVHLDMVADDQLTGSLTTLTVNNNNNNMIAAQGNAIQGVFFGNSNVDIAIESDIIDQAAFAGMFFDFNISNTLINTLRVVDNDTTTTSSNVGGPSGASLEVISRATSHLDMIVTGNDFDINVNQEGVDLDFLEDSQTRLLFENNVIDTQLGAGLAINVVGDNVGARNTLLATIRGNSILSSGGQSLPIIATNDAIIATRIENNTIGNGEAGIRASITTTGTADISATLTNNVITGSPTVAELVVAQNGLIGSELCVALSGNAILPNGYFVQDGDGVTIPATATAAMFLEIDGATNTPVGPNLGSTFTPRAFGTTCEPAIQAVEAAFGAAGFP